MLTLIFALALAAAEPPAAPPPTRAEARAAARAEKARLRAEALAVVTCRPRTPTGSNFTQEVCLTKAQWDRIERDEVSGKYRSIGAPIIRGR
jgi:hypothetical protein